MLVAAYLGCRTLVSGSKLECVAEELEAKIPVCTILRENLCSHTVLPLTNGQGCDVIIMFQPQKGNGL